jgi:hypothetical protein
VIGGPKVCAESGTGTEASKEAAISLIERISRLSPNQRADATRSAQIWFCHTTSETVT